MRTDAPRSRLGRLGGASDTLLRGAGFFLLLQGFGQVLQLGSQLILARSLGAEGFGLFAFGSSVLAFVAGAAAFGVPKATLRFLPEYRAAGEAERAARYVAWSRRVTWIGPVVLGSVTSVAVLLSGARDSERSAVVLVAAVSLLAAVRLASESARLRAGQAIARAQLCAAVIPPAVLFGGALLFRERLVGPEDSAEALIVRGAGLALGWLAASAFLMGSAERASADPGDPADPTHWRSVATTLGATTVLQLGLQHLDLLLLPLWVGDAATGHYAAAARSAALLGWGLLAATSWAAPMISRLHAQGDSDGMQRLATRSARMATAFALVGAIVFATMGQRLLAFFGPGFEDAYPVLVLLAFAQVVNASTGPAGFLLTMTGHQRVALAVEAACAVLALVSLAILTPLGGVLGAAAALTTAIATRNAAMSWLAASRVGVRSFVF